MARSEDTLNAIKAVVAADVAKQDSRINFFLGGTVKGGWEAWLQVECAVGIVRAGIADDFSREALFPGNNQRCDLNMTGKKGTAIWVELKTQRASAYTQTITDLANDIAKIRGLGSEFNTESPAVAVAIFRLTGADRDVLDKARTDNMGHLEYLQLSFAAGKAVWTKITDKIRTIKIPTEVPVNNIIMATWRNTA